MTIFRKSRAGQKAAGGQQRSPRVLQRESPNQYKEVKRDDARNAKV